MAAFNLKDKASYTVHESLRVDTSDNEDHTFCGILFPIMAKTDLPVEKLLLQSLGIRGMLGPLTVWVTVDTADSPMAFLRATAPVRWQKVYEAEHEPSMRQYVPLELDPPIELLPGQVRAVYIHSALRNDKAIVYDNAYPHALMDDATAAIRFEDDLIRLFVGKAHLSPTPFGDQPIWGWGHAWRDHRAYVGQVSYGCIYLLWKPTRTLQFGDDFAVATKTLLLCQRRYESPLSMLPDECLYYILHLCKWDWFQDEETARLKKKRASQSNSSSSRRGGIGRARRVCRSSYETASQDATGGGSDEDADDTDDSIDEIGSDVEEERERAIRSLVRHLRDLWRRPGEA